MAILVASQARWTSRWQRGQGAVGGLNRTSWKAHGIRWIEEVAIPKDERRSLSGLAEAA